MLASATRSSSRRTTNPHGVRVRPTVGSPYGSAARMPHSRPDVNLPVKGAAVSGSRGLGLSIDAFRSVQLGAPLSAKWEHDLSSYEDAVDLRKHGVAPVAMPASVASAHQGPVAASTFVAGFGGRLRDLITRDRMELVQSVIGLMMLATIAAAAISVVLAFFSISNAPL